MQQGNAELQKQAASIVRDVKNALQSLHAQHQLLAASISQERQRIEGLRQNQSEIVGGMHLLGSHQSRQETTLRQHQEAASQLESNQNVLGGGVTQTMHPQAEMQIQIKNEMEAAY